MVKRQNLILGILGGMFVIVTGLISAWVNPTSAAPATEPEPQGVSMSYISIGAINFKPLYPQSKLSYKIDPKAQLLSLDSQNRGNKDNGNWFVAPLTLPDQSLITGLKVIGWDGDKEGGMSAELWRCENSLTKACRHIGGWETSESFVGAVDSGIYKLKQKERVDNSLYYYMVLANIWMVSSGSGLHSVLLEVEESVPSGQQAEWLDWTGPQILVGPGVANRITVCRNDQWQQYSTVCIILGLARGLHQRY